MLVNDGDEPVAVVFEGFVPFPETRARVDDPESSDGLLVVPDEQVVPEAPDLRAHVPEFEFVGEFYQLSAPLEAPDGTTTVTLEPDSELRAQHVVASPVGSLDPDGQVEDSPQHGIYGFESTLRLVRVPRRRPSSTSDSR